MSPSNQRKRGQPPSSPGENQEPKKRRSERVRSLQKARDETVTPTSNAKKAKSSADKDKSSADKGKSSAEKDKNKSGKDKNKSGKDKKVEGEDKADDVNDVSTMSPPSRPDGERAGPAPPSSPPPPPESQIATQVATQGASQSGFMHPEEEFDPKVWGYLDLITDPFGKSVKLDKDGAPPKDKSKIGKKSGAIGFLIGRHPECDLHIDNAVISNRHCIIYKEVTKGKPKAILEDLSSNGTWVNGVIVGRNNRRELQTGDEVEFAGGHKYHFRYPTGMFVSRFRDTFEMGPPLGSGHFATVYTAVEKKTGTQYAVKVFPKKRIEESASTKGGFQQEIAMLMSVSHPNVLGLKGTYEEEEGVYLVLELAPEGELFNYIIRRQKLSEEETRKIFKQLLSGLKYLHDRNIVHRDIKPENILLVNKDLHVKLADFGLAKIIGEDSFTTSLCGTPSYVAPEILEPSSDRKYSRAVDIWSLGVVLYICLCGFPPFSEELSSPQNPYTLAQQIKKGRFDFPSPYWDSVGDPALDLIERMLEVDPQRRITVDGALNHPWITEGHIDPGESCASLADAIENFGFVRRKAVHERTLLAEAPGLANPASQNPSKVKVQIHQQENGTKDGAGKLTKKAGNSLDPQTKAFIHMGGKGGDETLYTSGESSYVEVEASDGDEPESTT